MFEQADYLNVNAPPADGDLAKMAITSRAVIDGLVSVSPLTTEHHEALDALAETSLD